MRAGALKHQINIQFKTETQNAHGEAIPSWTTGYTCYAAIKALNGKEYFGSAEIQAEATHEITIRYVNGVTPAKRILYGTRVFDILAVNEDFDKNKMLVIIAKERL